VMLQAGVDAAEAQARLERAAGSVHDAVGAASGPGAR
jgi:hypothetical protein